MMDIKDMTMRQIELLQYVNRLTQDSHGASVRAGWWTLPEEMEKPENMKLVVATKLCLIHSEISEAMEGHRKGRMDEHLPHLPSITVELADAMIRILDLAGALGLDLGRAYVEKRAYNEVRADHKPEARTAAGGKSY